MAAASHELRTPLTSPRTNAAMLRNSELPQVSKERITGALEHELIAMQSFIEDLIDLARNKESLPSSKKLISANLFLTLPLAEGS
ncbi:histidine kinase dimerization/phospho-acceptor domain-containing protein [Paenarthrobacter sp. 4246]|uniref:histidine kinase dimerization/phospho-acceptor domain-containing protein n=1 Tax=Paenarthrobacter sp. 4246 TaxID=3156456 RepID=UPI0033958C77